MRSGFLQSKSLFFILTALIFVAGFIMWTRDLSVDPPMYYAGLGQSLSTDPAQYVYHARNKVLFGQADPLDYPRWIVYQNSLTSLVSYVVFSIAGVSLKTANLAGPLLCFAGLALLLLGVARHHRPWVTAAVAFCFVINVTLVTHGRLSYLENGLLFWACLLFFIYARWGERAWGIVLCGAAAAFATFTGKLFGALLLPALVAAVLVSNEPRRWRVAAYGVLAFAGTAVALVLILYGSDFIAAFSYYGEQSAGLRGAPEGLSSPWGFVEKLIAFGLTSRLYYRSPDLWLFLLAGGLLLPSLGGARRIRNLSPVVRFALFWAVCGIIGIMPLNYSPIRYATFLIPAMIVFCFAMFDSVRRAKDQPLVTGKAELAIAFVLAWITLYHLIGNVFFFNNLPGRWLVWATLPGGVLLALAFKLLAPRFAPRSGRATLWAALAAVLVLSVTVNAFRIRRVFLVEHNYNIKEANADLARILGPDAIVSGPYAPVLTVETNLRSLIHLFGVARMDSTLFDRMPVTHLLVDVDNYHTARLDYPVMNTLAPVATYWIRDFEVKLFDISRLFSNPRANAYKPTLYEQAMSYYCAKQYDSAFDAVSRFCRSKPGSRSAELLRCDLLARQGRIDESFRSIVALADRFPTDFDIQLECARFVQRLALETKDRVLQQKAMMYYERVVAADRYKSDYAYKVYQETAQKYSGR